MILRNEIFANVVDWLIKEKKIIDQKDLSHKTGITQTTISRIMKGKVEPKDDTLRKLNDAFGGIFNMQYLRAKSTYMLLEDAIYYEQHPEQDPLRDHELYLRKEENNSMMVSEGENNTPPIPQWADSLIQIISNQIKENEALHRELRHSIDKIDHLEHDLQTLLQTLKK